MGPKNRKKQEKIGTGHPEIGLPGTIKSEETLKIKRRP